MIATDGKLKHLSNGCFTIQNRSTERLALSFDCAVIERLVLSVVEVSRDSTTAKSKGAEV
ncbi:hypothetical protein [Nostoc sp. DSM 114159]|jgi:hypothetical protein